MPRGTFDPLVRPVRFYARIHAATLECVYCGRLIFLGKGQRDAKAYNRVTSTVTCPVTYESKEGTGQPRRRFGCGRHFLIGVVAWPLHRRSGMSPKPQTPPDMIPEPHQLAEIRAYAVGRFARKTKKLVGEEDGNQIEPPADLDHEPEGET